MTSPAPLGASQSTVTPKDVDTVLPRARMGFGRADAGMVDTPQSRVLDMPLSTWQSHCISRTLGAVKIFKGSIWSCVSLNRLVFEQMGRGLWAQSLLQSSG